MTVTSSRIEAVMLVKGSGEVLMITRDPALVACVPAAIPLAQEAGGDGHGRVHVPHGTGGQQRAGRNTMKV